MLSGEAVCENLCDGVKSAEISLGSDREYDSARRKYLVSMSFARAFLDRQEQI